MEIWVAVILPVSDGVSPDKIRKIQHKENGRLLKGKGKIMVVDDEEILLSSLQNALRRSGYEVTAMKDSLEALVLFRENPDEFDLIITDLTMPKITGKENDLNAAVSRVLEI
jgi:PleD family two-component response regulator